MSDIKDYIFNIGDEVITTEGEKGTIVDICRCKKCLDRGFCEPMWEDENGDKEYITDTEAKWGFPSFYKIGQYRFNSFDKDKVEKDITYFESIVNNLKNRLKSIEKTEKPDPYAIFFDETCTGWTKYPELNKIFLLKQEDYANRLLEARGYLFLNEVYDMLGAPRTKIGQIAGWTYNPENQFGDPFVSFGLCDSCNHEDVVRDTNVWHLRFNVVGNALDCLGD